MSELLAERYRLLQVLGSGGSATVYAARDEELDLPVAIKLLHPQLDEVAAKQILSEANIAMSLTHPNIISYHGACSIDGRHFIVLEQVDGHSLASLLEAGPLPVEQIRTVLVALASALSHAHAKGILHRDLSPANILIAPGDEPIVKLIDFGIAKLGFDAAAPTQTKNLGTTAYAAPEQLAGRPTPKSDLYGLGAVGFHMICGYPPPFERGYALRSYFPADTPTDLADLIEHCLALDQERRPASAEQLLDRLTTSVQHNTVQRRRRSTIAFSLLLTLGVALIFLATSVNEFQLWMLYQGAKLEQHGLVEWQSPSVLLGITRSAARYDDPRMLEALLRRHGLSADSRAQMVDIAFAESLAQGSVRSAEYLLEHGARLNDVSSNFSREQLLKVIHSESAPLLLLVIERGIDIDAELEAQDLFALTISHPDLAQFRVLIDHVAHRANNRPLNVLPLWTALSAKNEAALALVAAGGAPVLNAVDAAGSTTLVNLAVTRRFKDLKRVLSIKGIDPNIQNRDGMTPLLAVIESARNETQPAVEQVELIKLLFAVGASPTDRGGTWLNPLMLAATGQNAQIIELLLNHPKIGPIDERDKDGFTALRHAVDPDGPFNPAVVQALLARGASPEVPDVTGVTVRRIAVLAGREGFLPPLKQVQESARRE